MREHHPADHVADGEDVRHGRPQVSVDDDAVLGVGDPGLLEPEPVDDGLPADREQDRVADDARAARAEDRGPAVDELQGLDARAREDAHALLLEVRLQEVAELLVLAVGEVLAPLDDRHLGAEPPVRLRELERHGAGADADEMPGQLGDVHQVVARHGRHPVGARHGRARGAASLSRRARA